MVDDLIKGLDNPNLDLNKIKELNDNNKVNDQVLVLLNNLSLEDFIALKLE